MRRTRCRRPMARSGWSRRCSARTSHRISGRRRSRASWPANSARRRFWRAGRGCSIDLNRGADDPTLVMKLSDGSIIPGNARIDAAEIAQADRAFHAPYHAAIAQEIAAMRASGLVPAIVSMHSFTPVWKGPAAPLGDRHPVGPRRPAGAAPDRRVRRGPASWSATTSPIPASWRMTASIATARCWACRMC